MAYTLQGFKNGDVLKAEHLNHIENGIVALDDKLNGMSSFTTDNTLRLSEDKVLSVNMATTKDRTLPIKAVDVDVIVGNIDALLQTI